jgi:hypothetical protein
MVYEATMKDTGLFSIRPFSPYGQNIPREKVLKAYGLTVSISSDNFPCPE